MPPEGQANYQGPATPSAGASPGTVLLVTATVPLAPGTTTLYVEVGGALEARAELALGPTQAGGFKAAAVAAGWVVVAGAAHRTCATCPFL